MKLSSNLQSFSIIATLTLAFIVGCDGGGASLKGTVTFNGQPVKSGNISFNPEGGAGSPVGGEITDGKYSIKNVPAGKYRVLVSSYTRGSASDNMDDAIKAAKTGKKSADEVAPTDEGNNQTHEVKAGADLDLTLKSASTSGSKPK